MGKVEALRILAERKNELTRQQLLTLRGQVLAGNVAAAMRGLARIVQTGGGV